MRRALALAGLAVLLAGCGGYAGDNRELVAEVPEPDGVVLLSEQEYGYCSGQRCVLRNDRSATLLVYSVDTQRWTRAALVDAYRTALADWTATVGRGCTDPADLATCDGRVAATFVRGDARIDVHLGRWPDGRFEVEVDALGAGQPEAGPPARS